MRFEALSGILEMKNRLKEETGTGIKTRAGLFLAGWGIAGAGKRTGCRSLKIVDPAAYPRVRHCCSVVAALLIGRSPSGGIVSGRGSGRTRRGRLFESGLSGLGSIPVENGWLVRVLLVLLLIRLLLLVGNLTVSG